MYFNFSDIYIYNTETFEIIFSKLERLFFRFEKLDFRWQCSLFSRMVLQLRIHLTSTLFHTQVDGP